MKLHEAAIQLVVAIQATLAVQAASAQAILPEIVVTFDAAAAPATVPVPISRWTLLSLGVLLTLVAYRVIRRRAVGGAAGRWFVVALTATVLSLAFSTADSVREAQAAPPQQSLALGQTSVVFTVPASALFNMNQSGGGSGFMVTNKTGYAATVTGRSFNNNSTSNPLLFYMPGPPGPGPECAAGYVLAPDVTCWVFVRLTVSWS